MSSRTVLILETLQPGPPGWTKDPGHWEEANRWALGTDEELERAKEEARNLANFYKGVRLVRHTVIRTVVDEEVDFSE